MPALRIILLCIAAAVVYGILHDQITARVCVEYFTVAHPRIFGDTTSPTLLGIGWGIVATWWVGAILGVLLAITARAGRRPCVSARDLAGPLTKLLLLCAALALIAGIVGYVMARSGAVQLVGSLANRISPERHARFLADGFAHTASYVAGAVGGLVLCVRTFRRRRLIQPENTPT